MAKYLVIVTALLEAATGLALLAMPSAIASLLLGATLDTAGAVTIARVAGAALLTIAFICWQAREDSQSRPGRAVVGALLIYNLAVAALLVHGSLALKLAGPGLWPAVIAHGLLAAWCIAGLRGARGAA